jgi:CO/xanthine dehydrogenase Mo-binding subunit
MEYIGKSLKRVDVRDKVTGEALYPADLNMPDQAYMKILFAGTPHAVVKAIDTSRAENLEGVLAVYTARDVPVNEYGLQIADQPVLCGPGSDKPHADRVRFIGDQVAVVVAETVEIAARALDLIEVEYEELPVITDPFQALEEDALLLHPDQGTNIAEHYQIKKGDVEQAFQEADVVVESEYYTPPQEHAYLQPEAGLAYIDDQGRVTVAVAGQWAHEEQEQIAHALDLPREKVRVIHPEIGGAFGGREDMSIQIVLGLAVMRLHERGINRPVKVIWSREESIIGHHKRHPYFFKTRWGATKDGKITAVQAEVTGDAGAYMYTTNKVLGNAAIMSAGAYKIPNVDIEARGVYTNHVPSGAFRGFGAPQGAFMAETQVNKLAEALDMDPVEIRVRNVLQTGDPTATREPLPGRVTLKEVIQDCAQRSGWEYTPEGWELVETPEGDSKKRGKGFACGFKNVGFSFGYQEKSWAAVEIQGGAEIEKVVVRQAAAEVGQGAHMVMIQAAAEALEVAPEKIELITADTAETEDSGSVSASRMTFMGGNAVKGAAEKAFKKWKDEERPAVAEYTYLAPKTTAFDPETGEAMPNFSYGYVAQTVEVEVDTETGHVDVTEVYSAHDVGKAFNPQQVEGQIEGGVAQALGYTVLENFLQEGGHVQTSELSTYLIPTVRDIPEKVHSIILEYAEENGPWGARGMAEMPYIPLAPAIIAAVHDAIGVWIDDFPLTPERVLRALGKID